MIDLRLYQKKQKPHASCFISHLISKELVLILCFLMIMSIFPSTSWAQLFTDIEMGEDFNPFQPKLPQAEEFIAPEETYEEEEFYVEPDFSGIIVEGVIWGTDMPQAIINGDTYKIGDKLADVESTIVGINKDGITVKHLGRRYEIKIKKKVLNSI